MRKEFTTSKTKKLALSECPWASKAMKVCGGYICFESVSDYRTHKNQK